MSRQGPVQIKRTSAAADSDAAGRVLQRKCACGNHTVAGGTCAECAKATERSWAKVKHPRLSTEVPPIVHQVLRSIGESIDPQTRTFMASRFGHDFSRVRVHTNAEAAASARAVNALAYTVGSHVVFGHGQYAPHSAAGRRLIAHELAHGIQQRFATPALDGLHIDDASSSAEREGSKAADAVMSGNAPHLTRRETVLARQTPTAEQPASLPTAPTYGVTPEPTTTERGDSPGPGHPLPRVPPCPLGITGPKEVNHYCAAYVPSDAASCGTFPAPNITLTATGAAAGKTLTWDVVDGAKLASIVGATKGDKVDIKGDDASVTKEDVAIRVSDGTCAARHTITVRKPTKMTAAQSPSSGPAFIKTLVTYTVKDQFDGAMGAGICCDETITVCSRSHQISPTFGDAATDSSGQVNDNLSASVASGSLPASLCVKLDQVITAGGCGPLLHNTILFRPAGITLTPGAGCAAGDPCP
jgi:hypothetical protein